VEGKLCGSERISAGPSGKRSLKEVKAVGIKNKCLKDFVLLCAEGDRICGLVVRVPGCIPRGSGFDSRDL
jgi:hypothetical protein